MAGRQVQAFGGVAEAHRRQRHAFQLEGVHDLVEAAVQLAEHARGGHRDVVQDDLAGVGGVPAHLRQGCAERQARGRRLDQERADPASARIRRGLRGHDQHIGRAGVGDEHLAAVQPPPGAVTDRRGGDGRHIRARSRLGDGQRRHALPACQRGQVGGPLPGGAVLDDMGCRHVRADQRAYRDAPAGPGQLFGQQGHGQLVAPAAAVFFRRQQAQQPGRAEFLLQLPRHAAQGFGLTDGRPHMPVHERAAHRLEVAVLGVKFPVHRQPPELRPSHPLFDRPDGRILT